MIIFCEECGERYIIEDEDIKGSAMIFICNVCNEIIRVPARKEADGPAPDKVSNSTDNV